MSEPQADLTVVHLIHRAIRRDLGAFAGRAPGEPSEAARSYWDDLAEQIHHHHHVEDDEVWGLLNERDAGAAACTGRMEDQHRDVVKVLERLAADEGTFSRHPELVAELDRVMSAHLDDEEATAFPLMQSAMSFQEMAEFGQRQLMAMSEAERGFFLPWILFEAPAEEAGGFRGVLPPPIVELIDSRLMPSFQEARSAALA